MRVVGAGAGHPYRKTENGLSI